MSSFMRASWPLVAASVGIIGGFGWISARALTSREQKHTELVTTLAEVRSRPDHFSGKRLRLTGQLTECYQWECSLCPEGTSGETRNAEQCLPLSFRPLISGTGFGSDKQESVFRFSSVVLNARFDPACWKTPCLDRQTVLDDAIVEKVIKRRDGASGLWLGETHILAPLNGALASTIEAAAHRAGYPGGTRIRSFATKEPQSRLVVCWSPSIFHENEPGAMPKTLENALYARSTLDFFKCNDVRKIEGLMVVQVSPSSA